MTQTAFSPRLEALRGIAALMVAYSHSLGAIAIQHTDSAAIKSWLNVLGNGCAGVTLFFVLSGHVLNLSLSRDSSPLFASFTSFLTRRVLRIWPTMLVCLAACAIWLIAVHHPVRYPAASVEYHSYWQNGASLEVYLHDAFFLTYYLNPVTWTLQVEMIAALLFVPMWRATRRSFVLAALLLVGWTVFFLATPLYGFARSGFVFMFLLGMHAGSFSQWLSKRLNGQQIRWGVIAAFAALCVSNHLIPETHASGWVVSSIAAYSVISLLSASEGRTSIPLLDTRLSHFLGRISYSFYLWHFPVLYVLGTLGFATLDPALCQRWPNLLDNLLFAISVLVTIPLAWLSHRALERPCITFANTLTRKPSVKPTHYAHHSG